MLRLFSVLCRVSGFGRRCRAWCPRWLSWFCVPVVVPAFGVLLCVLCRVVGSVFFVRRPCPSCPWGFWSSRCWWRWCCLPSSSVAAFRASVPVLVVAPAVVVRFGRCRGVVLSSWVFFCSLGFPEGTTTTNCEPPTTKPPYGGESGGNAAAVAAASLNHYQEVTKNDKRKARVHTKFRRFHGSEVLPTAAKRRTANAHTGKHISRIQGYMRNSTRICTVPRGGMGNIRRTREVSTCITTVKKESTSSFASGQMPAAKGQTPDKQTGKHGRLTCRSPIGFSMQKVSRTGTASSLTADMISIWNTRWSAYGTVWNSSVRRCSGSITPCLTSRA